MCRDAWSTRARPTTVSTAKFAHLNAKKSTKVSESNELTELGLCPSQTR
jgi:hypothetical protein